MGAISVLLNWRLTVSELEYIVEDSAPKAIVYDDIFEQQVVELISLCGVPDFLRISRDLSDNPYEEALAKCPTIFVAIPKIEFD